MCLALYKPAAVQPDWEALENAMTYNPDGAGFAVAVDGQLIIEKGFFKWEDFRKAFEPFCEHASVVHFRLATHGAKNQANCHPFALADFGMPEGHQPVAVIHNGIFSDAKSDQKQWSDTWHVCRDILHPLWAQDEKAFGKDHVLLLGDKFVGYSNKLVFLHADGTYAIWGESNGHWSSEGIWYSNHSYECSSFADPRYRGSKTRGYGASWDADDYSEYWESRGYKSAADSAKTIDKHYSKEELDDFALGTLDADQPILDLDSIAGDREQVAIKELRDCGYTEVEIENIYLDDGLDGLIAELALAYTISEDDMSIYVSQTAANNAVRNTYFDELIDVVLNPDTNLYEPAK